MLIAACLAALAAWLAWPDERVLRGRSPSLPRLLTWWRRPPAPDAAPALSALAAELAAGASLDGALRATPHAGALWPHAWAASTSGGDVAAGLDADGARALAACWRVAGDSGAGLARSIASLAAHERSARAVRMQLAAELSSSRASTRLLALLPLVGIAMGMLLGADPIGFLTTGLGLLCVLMALVLVGLGLAWSARIVRAVERLL